MSDMDSDCDDVFTEDSKSCSGDNKSVSGTEDEGRNIMNRKRRRGIIEKRRRDRINNSLSELRRLVPAAFEKQGSAKLEKAEILQMTVDHLRQLHSRGIDIFSLEPYKLITDYHGVGFRECASEVARYLAAFEGLDLQDPLRLRLMSHLQCFSAQRDALTTPQQPPPAQPPWFTQLPVPAAVVPPVLPTPQYPHQLQSRASSISDMSLFSSSSRSDRASSSTDSRVSSVGSPRARNPSIPISPLAMSASPYLAGYSRPPVILSESSSNKSPSIKPYRPWGTELAC